MKEKNGKLCRERKVEQELTTADSPEYNGEAERGLAMIESATLANGIQASESFPGYSIPEGPSLWAESMHRACDAYNRTATVANSGNRSPHEMFYGETLQSSPIPFLKLAFCKLKRTNKRDPKARGYFYLGPARNHPSESKRVLVRTRKVVITTNVTWAHVPLSCPPTVRSTFFVEMEGCDHGRVTSAADDTEVENTPLALGRAVSTTSRAGSSVYSGVSFDPKGRGAFSEGCCTASRGSEETC